MTIYILLDYICLLYCPPLRRPYQVNNTILLERVEEWTSNFILNDYTLDYKFCLMKLNIFVYLSLEEILSWEIPRDVKGVTFPVHGMYICYYMKFVHFLHDTVWGTISCAFPVASTHDISFTFLRHCIGSIPCVLTQDRWHFMHILFIGKLMFWTDFL